MVDNGIQPGALRESQGALVSGPNDNVPAIDQAAFARGRHDIEHVG
jgi:hypothetical protein